MLGCKSLGRHLIKKHFIGAVAYVSQAIIGINEWITEIYFLYICHTTTHHKIPTMVSDGIKWCFRCLEALKLEWIHLVAIISVSSTFEHLWAFSSDFPSNPLHVPWPQHTYLQIAEEFEFPCADWILNVYKKFPKAGYADLLPNHLIIWNYIE